MIVKSGDILIIKKPLEVYTVTSVNDAFVKLRPNQDKEEWYVPAAILKQLDPSTYVRITPEGEVFTDCSEFRELGWHPDMDLTAKAWAILYIKRLLALLKGTSYDQSQI